MARNIAFSLTLYSGQMCTAPQNLYIPRDGIATPNGRIGFDQVLRAIADAVAALTFDAAKVVDLTGAIQNTGVLDRIDAARALGEVVLDSRALTHPQYPEARIRTPLIVKMAGADEDAIMRELFGPIALGVPTDSTAHSIALAAKAVRGHGALTLSLYARDPQLIERVEDMAQEVGVALSVNLTGAVFVNHSAAFSDYHGTGANPVANAALCDSAFVANRFRVVQSRKHV